jgi:pimeloyl-ACP methyl ester carboxylesterase
MASSVAMTGSGPAAEPIELQRRFDSIPAAAPVRTLEADGRRVRYVDTGRPDWDAVVFFGGLGTSVGAYLLTEFARSTRERLRLRLISVERAGFGLSPLDRDYDYRVAATDALAVLAELGIGRYRIVAVSGGGPYAVALAASAPDRVVSLHLAAAAAGPLLAETSGTPLAEDAIAEIVRDPTRWWEYPTSSPVHQIPGFDRTAAAEGRRALWLTGHGEAALAAEWRRLCEEPLPDLSAVTAPAHLYWGTEDDAVTPAHAARWSELLPRVVARRQYAGEGHDIQYRHWDQILLDAAGLGRRTLIAHAGRAWLAEPEAVGEWLSAGATLGLTCWSPA